MSAEAYWFDLALGLELLEEGQGFFELAGKTLAVDAQVESALGWLSSDAAMARACWTVGRAEGRIATPKVRRLVSNAATRLWRQAVSARDWTKWDSAAPWGLSRRQGFRRWCR